MAFERVRRGEYVMKTINDKYDKLQEEVYAVK